jgi:hypothetical protein
LTAIKPVEVLVVEPLGERQYDAARLDVKSMLRI